MEMNQKYGNQAERGPYYWQYLWNRESCYHQETFEAWLLFNYNKRTFNPGKLSRVTREHAFRYLGLPTTATFPEIRRKFRQLASQYHPDRPGGSSEKFQLIFIAYEVIKSAFMNPPSFRERLNAKMK
jgi:DnaJ-domain-containing protein 1